MKLSLSDKTFRVIRFLLGLRSPRIATALAGYGFKQEDRDEGWALINALGKSTLGAMPSVPRDMETLLKLDAWENQWFPIAFAALDRRFPAVNAKFFLNLTQTEGPGVAISVRTFVDRFDELGAGVDKFGAEAPKALELLIQRGVTAAVVQEAKTLLASLTQLAAPAELPSIEEQEESLAEAELAMWSWYLEWSQIARVAIKQRALLRELGFLNTKRGEEEEEVPVTTPPPGAPAAPTTGAAPAAPSTGASPAAPTTAAPAAPVAATPAAPFPSTASVAAH